MASHPATAAATALDIETRVRQCIADLKASTKQPRAQDRTCVGSLDLHLQAIYRLELAACTLGELAAACEGWPVHVLSLEV